MRPCVARMDAVADEIVLFQLGELPDGVTELVKLVVRAADIAREAVPLLARPRRLSEHLDRAHPAGQAGGAGARRLLAHVTATTVATWRCWSGCPAVAQSLRRWWQAFEDIADALQTVAVKEA